MAQGTEKRSDIVDEEASNGGALSNYTKAASKRTRGRKSIHPSSNAARERSRVQNLKQAFLELQKALPNVPSGTKLSKLDILLLATNYISHLMSKLSNGHLKVHFSRLKDKGALHPIKKWPMRSRLYVSDPMWLYRSGRQSIISQRIESRASSGVSCEESPPRLEPFDTESSSCLPMEVKEGLSFQSIYREDTIIDRGVDINIRYAYHGTERPFMGSMEEERQNFRTSSCRYQKTLPEL